MPTTIDPVTLPPAIPTTPEQWAGAEGSAWLAWFATFSGELNDRFTTLNTNGIDTTGAVQTTVVRLQDESGNSSPTAGALNTVAMGDMIFCSVTMLNVEVATAVPALNTAERIVLPLPFTSSANMRGGGIATWSSLSSLNGSGVSPTNVRVIQGDNRAVFVNPGGTAASANLQWGNVASGSTSLTEAIFYYFRA